jgi:hypothetical protein
MHRARLLLFALAISALTGLGCRDTSRFSTNDGDRFEGSVVAGSFVRSGVEDDARMCLSLDGDQLQVAPGAITTSDGRFQSTPLRPIPQVWHDPLSTLSFGEGRTKNLLYVATPASDGGTEADVMIVLSLMQSGGVEVRMLRGAPSGVVTATEAPTNLFAIFTLRREKGPCSF